MARIKGKDIYLKDDDQIYFGDGNEAALWYEDDDLQLNHTISGVAPTKDGHLVTKKYIDDQLATVSGGIVQDHGGLVGLGDDDHTQYLLADGSRALTEDWNYGSNSISGTGSFYGNGATLSNISYVESNDVYFYDSGRDKHLGSGIVRIACCRNSANTTNQYLRTYDGTPMNMVGVAVIFDATLVGISMSGGANNDTWTAQVRKNGVATSLDSLSITNAYENHDWSKDTDFSAGDRIQVYLSGTGVSYPHVSLYFRRRKS